MALTLFRSRPPEMLGLTAWSAIILRGRRVFSSLSLSSFYGRVLEARIRGFVADHTLQIRIPLRVVRLWARRPKRATARCKQSHEKPKRRFPSIAASHPHRPMSEPAIASGCLRPTVLSCWRDLFSKSSHLRRSHDIFRSLPRFLEVRHCSRTQNHGSRTFPWLYVFVPDHPSSATTDSGNFEAWGERVHPTVVAS